MPGQVSNKHDPNNIAPIPIRDGNRRWPNRDINAFGFAFEEFYDAVKRCLWGGMVSLCIVTGACGSQVPLEYQSFFAQPLAQRHEQFRTFPLDKQLLLYRYALMRHPPDLGFGYDIARRGKSAVPTLVAQLSQEEEDGFKLAIIEIFSFMSPRYYKVWADQSLMESLQQGVSSIRNSGLRQDAERLMLLILKDQQHGSEGKGP